MAFFEWTDSLAIGVELIDSEHKKLIAAVNDFYNAVHKGDDEAATRKAVAHLVYYVKTHFADEESLMEKCNYPRLAQHRKMHEMLTERVARYADKLKKKEKILSLDMAIFLKGWLENHIAETDNRIADFIKNQKK
jgi:hemerythrin-like metal-binding protein